MTTDSRSTRSTKHHGRAVQARVSRLQVPVDEKLRATMSQIQDGDFDAVASELGLNTKSSAALLASLAQVGAQVVEEKRLEEAYRRLGDQGFYDSKEEQAAVRDRRARHVDAWS